MNKSLNGIQKDNNYQEEKFNSFINKIILMSSKEYFRKQMKDLSREKTIVDDENYSAFLQDFVSFNNIKFFTDSVENKVELNNALHSLSAIEQAVIFLLFKEDVSSDEAAQILEICSKSVSRIKLRAINKLKKFMKGDVKNEK